MIEEVFGKDSNLKDIIIAINNGTPIEDEDYFFAIRTANLRLLKALIKFNPKRAYEVLSTKKSYSFDTLNALECGVFSGSIEMLKYVHHYLSRDKENLNRLYNHGFSNRQAISYAIYYGNLQMTKFLVENDPGNNKVFFNLYLDISTNVELKTYLENHYKKLLKKGIR